MSRKASYLAMLALLVALIACAPNPAPVALAPTPQPTPSIPRPATTPSLNPEDVAWAQVLEAAKKEGRVVAYDYFMPGDVGLAVSAAFENRYGLKMDLIPGRGAEILERLKTERRMGPMTADMVGSSPAHLTNMANEGLIEATADKLPVLREADVWVVKPLALDPKGGLLVFTFENRFPYANTKLLKIEDAPKTLQDFLHPRWKGKIVTYDPVLTGDMFFTTLLSRGIIDLKYLSALGDQNLVFQPSARNVVEMLARGEVPLTTPSVDSSVVRVALEGAPIQALPFEYNVALTNGIAAVKGAPHPNATFVYLNWRLSQEGQLIFSKASGIVSIRKDVPDFRPPSMRAQADKLIVVTVNDVEDSARSFREKALVPLLKR